MDRAVVGRNGSASGWRWSVGGGIPGGCLSAKEETGALALEDVPPEAGILALAPRGPPTTYGPHQGRDGTEFDAEEGVG